ncbi:MAG TPA: arylsulfotransferase family protein [Solirubrobacteraceae bacterium]|nr:arylsulfotransferase family protein [Solirubrobacteraceae bacterium]
MSTPSSSPTANRREFLRLAGGTLALGTSAGLTLTACSSSKASSSAGGSLPTLHSSRGGNTVKGIQHFRSRPDLRPPEIIIHTHAKHVIPGFVFTECHGGVAQQGPMILTEKGRLVGFQPLTPKPTPAHRAFDVRVQTYQGKPVMTWFEGGVVSAHGQGHYVICDQQYRQIAQVHAGNGYQGDLHEFLLTPQGTALFTAYGKAAGRFPNGKRGNYFYGIVQEVDVATGKVLFQWRSDRHVPLSASYRGAPTSASSTWDYFHVNGITIDPTDNNLVISSRNTCACYKVDRRTGRVIWTLGGKHSNFHMGRGSRFYFQHDITLLPGGVMTMFDNEGGPPFEAKQSRGLVLAIDERRRTARVRRQFHHKPPVLSEALGSIQRLDKGHTFMGWGTSSYFTEYGPGGAVLFDGRLKPGTSSYRAYKETWTGTPTTVPSLAATRRGAGATLYASWNFATEVAGWVVFAGRSPDQLPAVGTAKLAGFETEISLPHARPYVAVAAIDRKGTILARSKPVKV